MAKAKTPVEETLTTFDSPEVEVEQKSVMVDDRDEKARIADIKAANLDRQVVLAREIEAGKPFPCHPVVITDLDYVLQYAARLEKKVALYEKRLALEMAEA
jgi:hypothetical protein